MSPAYHYSILLRPAVPFECWQAGEVAPIDCSTFTAAVETTNLPWTPAVEPVAAALGRYRLAAPTIPQAAQLRRGKSYSATVMFRNGAGDPVLAFELTLVATP